MILASASPHEIVYLDPPWHRTPCGTARTPYRTMSWTQLLAFDLGAWLARDAMVFCWMTGPTQLRESAVLLHWCGRFKLHEAGTAYIWLKTKQPRHERAEQLRSIILDWSATDAERRKALAELEDMLPPKLNTLPLTVPLSTTRAPGLHVRSRPTIPNTSATAPSSTSSDPVIIPSRRSDVPLGSTRSPSCLLLICIWVMVARSNWACNTVWPDGLWP